MARLLGALLLLAPALALVVAATSSVGGATNHTAAFNVYAALLQTPAGFHGSVKKQGMLPPNKWSEDLYNKTHGKQFFRWLHASISDRTGEVTKVPPLTHVCGLWINHAYKVIFVRNRKAASTTLVNALGKPCRETTAPGAADAVLPCMEKVTSLKAFTDKGINPETVWRDYLVFGVARNPWARAASGYDYSTRKEQDPSLDPNFKNDKNHTFLEYCSDPMVLGKHCYELGADKCPG